MRKTPDIGADTNPCLSVKPSADVERPAVLDGGDPFADLLEPLAQAIDVGHDTATPASGGVTVPVSTPPAFDLPGVWPAPPRVEPSRPSRPEPLRDPFVGNPLAPNGAVADRPRRNVWIASVTVHVLVAAIVLLLPQRTHHGDEAVPIEISFYSPEAVVAEVESPPQPEPAVVEPPVVEERQPEPIVAEAEPPPPPMQEPVAARVITEARPPEPVPPLPEPVRQPEPPRPQVRTNVLAEAEPAPPVKRKSPPRTAKLAGFTRAETVAAEAPEAERQVARAGAFESEPEPQPAAPAGTPQQRVVASGRFSDGPVTVPRAGKTARRSTVAAASFDTADDRPAPAEPKRQRTIAAGAGFAAAETEPTPQSAPRDRGTVTSIGFDAGEAVADATPRSSGAVTRGSFGTQETATASPGKRRRPAEDLDQPVEILSKTNPAYTDKARELRVEGEVVLEVMFDASGVLRVLRVVAGLGHGLDDEAVKAAEKIEFEPARRDGKPVDYTATLRVVFRLA